MKKILSIFLVACMLLTMSIVAFAEDDGTNTELEKLGYKPISTAEELTSMKDNNRYYLKNDITLPQGAMGRNVSGVTIDGNGHTVTFDNAYFIINWGNTATIENLNIAGTITVADGEENVAWKQGDVDRAHCGPVAMHGFDGTLIVRNCTSAININITKTDTGIGGSVGGFLGKSHAADATWENVKFTGSINIGGIAMENDSMQMRTIGGLAGMSGSTLKAVNVESTGTINVNATNVHGIGGLFGTAQSGSQFTNCKHNGTLTFGGEANATGGIGGVVGYAANDPCNAEGLFNYGEVKATNPVNEGPVGGVFGQVSANKASMLFNKVTNEGNVTGTKSAGGIIGELTSGSEIKEENPGFTLTAVMNKGNISAPIAAGGLVGKINQLIPKFVIEFSDVVNTGDVATTAAEGAEGSGAVVGVMPAAPEDPEAYYSFTVKSIYHTGTVSGALATPLMKLPDAWKLGETGQAYYSQDASAGTHFGEKVEADVIEEMIAEINFIQVDKYLLTTALRALEGKLESDYTAESWKAVVDAIAEGTTVNENKDAKQDEVDAATKKINDAAAALTLKPLDKAALDALIAQASALKEEDYRGDTWRRLDRALTAAKAEFTLQSQVDKALADLQEAIDKLALIADETEPPVVETDPPAVTDPPATIDGPAATTAAPKDDGCGSAIATTAVVLTAVLALGAGVAFKKKED